MRQRRSDEVGVGRPILRVAKFIYRVSYITRRYKMGKIRDIIDIMGLYWEKSDENNIRTEETAPVLIVTVAHTAPEHSAQQIMR